ncbi:MAG TPA: hypothetical protein P5125_07805 [Kiritimatiellia bacterium]|nr:hypothetical protein [Kiritimatiellia bacterium]
MRVEIWIKPGYTFRERRRGMSDMSKMSKTVYTVHAYRWGDRERHSYTVGVYSQKHAAMKAADIEEDYRGGKYRCEVLGWQLDSGREGNHDIAPKTVKPLPTEITLEEDDEQAKKGGEA